jgi:hypothetical protein
MGVQFFGGKFFKCIDDDGEILPVSVSFLLYIKYHLSANPFFLQMVNDRWECEDKNYSWINSKITFDHVGMGYLALLQVATFEGWMEIMADAGIIL